jgi:hypothetical protein
MRASSASSGASPYPSLGADARSAASSASSAARAASPRLVGPVQVVEQQRARRQLLELRRYRAVAAEALGGGYGLRRAGELAERVDDRAVRDVALVL